MAPQCANPAIQAAVQAALAAYVACDEGSAHTAAMRTALEHSIRRYGADLRSRGVRPEHFVPPVRNTIRALLRAIPGLRSDDAAALVRDAVKWGIDGYYA